MTIVNAVIAGWCAAFALDAVHERSAGWAAWHTAMAALNLALAVAFK